MADAAIKILHIDTGKGWRGGQQQVLNLAKLLHENKYATGIVCQPSSEMQARASALGIPVFIMKMGGELDFISGFRLASICRKYKFPIVQLHNAHAHTLGLWAKLFYRQVRLISVRRVDFHIHSKWKYNHPWIDRIVCISHAIKQVLIKDGIDQEKLMLIHSGIDLNRFSNLQMNHSLRHSLNIPGNHLIIGTIAALAGHKDYPNLLRAAQLIVDQIEEVTFCVVGDGPDKEKIYALAASLNLGARFKFVGFQSDVGSYLNMFDLFVMASKKEGLGTSLLDALVFGLPVIACKSGGIPEIIKDGENGLLVPPQDANALAQACIRVIREKNLRKQLASNAKKYLNEFDMRHMYSEYLRLYRVISIHTSSILEN